MLRLIQTSFAVIAKLDARAFCTILYSKRLS
jgi:hypothetical protein